MYTFFTFVGVFPKRRETKKHPHPKVVVVVVVVVV